MNSVQLLEGLFLKNKKGPLFVVFDGHHFIPISILPLLLPGLLHGAILHLIRGEDPTFIQQY